MREVFCEFYRPDEEGLRRFMTEATVIPDTNVLLGLYRLGSTERKQVLDVFAQIGERLWLPYQVGLEYQRRRLSVVRAQASVYEQARAIHGLKNLPGMQAYLRELNVPNEVREAIEPLLPELHESVRSAMKPYEDVIDNLTGEHVVTVEQALLNDPVRARLDELFAHRVGAKPNAQTWAARITEGLRRGAERIPPGYKDGDKESDEAKSGDYLIWAEILDFAEKSDAPVLFVTSDEKEDWFHRFGGAPQGPRPELVAEFRERSKLGYHQVTLVQFLNLANEFLKTEVTQATITRVGEPHEADLFHKPVEAKTPFLLWLDAVQSGAAVQPIEDRDQSQQQLHRLIDAALTEQRGALRELHRLKNLYGARPDPPQTGSSQMSVGS